MLHDRQKLLQNHKTSECEPKSLRLAPFPAIAKDSNLKTHIYINNISNLQSLL